MHDLTPYFLTLDRPHAADALDRLCTTQRLAHPVVVIRGVRPLAAALAPILACPTPLALVLDEDVLLRPGVVPICRAELLARRVAEPDLFLLSGDRFTDDGTLAGGGGFKIYDVPSLRRVGFPDAPHMSYVQELRAARLGLRKLSSAVTIGTRGAGTATDVYKRVLWDQLRYNAGQDFNVPRPDPDALAARARASADPRWWAAALGALDGLLARRPPGSKDDAFRGPLAATLDLDALDPATAAALFAAHRAAARRALIPHALRHAALRQARRVRRVMNDAFLPLLSSTSPLPHRTPRPAEAP